MGGNGRAWPKGSSTFDRFRFKRRLRWPPSQVADVSQEKNRLPGYFRCSPLKKLEPKKRGSVKDACYASRSLGQTFRNARFSAKLEKSRHSAQFFFSSVFFFLPTRFRRTEGGTCVSCSRLPDRGLAARAEGGPRPSYDPPPPSRLCSMREGGRLSSDGGPAIGLASDLETSPWAHVKQWRIRCAYNTHTHTLPFIPASAPYSLSRNL